MVTYPKVYHLACNHLVAFGGHGGNTRQGRIYIACALRAIRAQSREWAQQERRHMLFIAGHFPVKVPA
jgi:hypothetical protein